jgi:uncharacterized protein YdeI (YjbR/CyaY-like superfamily)
MAKKISGGVVHILPEDLRKMLSASLKAHLAWEDITSLARNEWICWITSPKLITTRREHIERARAQLIAGKRRPCCWPGCPHRAKKQK